MVSGKVFQRIATTAAIAGMMFTTIGDIAGAVTALKDGDEINGFIRSNSPSFTFKNQSRAGAPTQKAIGEDYTFSAQRGDSIEINIDPEDGSNLKPALVLLSPQGRQVAFDSSLNVLRYRVPAAGTYKLLVVGQNNTRGRYVLNINGISQTTQQVFSADQVMQDVLKLPVVGCGVPNVARIKIGNEERCTRGIEAGVYVYDQATASVKQVDQRRELIGQRLQLSMLERCPSVTTSVVQIGTIDPQDGRNHVYCATPNRFVKAGTYRYDISRDDLIPTDAAGVQNPTGTSTTGTSTSPTTADARRDRLQTEFGLRVLDNCPPARTSLAVISFPENNESYIYCANPNARVPAGEYTYNTARNSLEPAKRPAPACTVSVGGICLVK